MTRSHFSNSYREQHHYHFIGYVKSQAHHYGHAEYTSKKCACEWNLLFCWDHDQKRLLPTESYPNQQLKFMYTSGSLIWFLLRRISGCRRCYNANFFYRLLHHDGEQGVKADSGWQVEKYYHDKIFAHCLRHVALSQARNISKFSIQFKQKDKPTIEVAYKSVSLT